MFRSRPLRSLRPALAVLLAASLGSSAFAQEDPAPDEAPAEAPAAEEAPAPGTSMELVSGEQLRGTLVQIKGGTVTFTSEQLGKQEVPLDTVKSLSTDSPHTVVMPGGGSVDGTVFVADGQVTVTPSDGSGAQTFAVADLGAVNPDPEKTELDYWTVTATVGATATYGNTRTRTLFAIAAVQREDDTTRFRLAYTGIFGTDNQTTGVGATRSRAGENAKSHRLDFQFDYKITERFYATPAVGHVLYDKFQNIERRGSIGSGVGYKILLEDDLRWNVEVGFAYTELRLRRTPPARLPARNEASYSTAARVASAFYCKVSDRVTFDAFWESFIGTKDIEDTFHRATFSLAYELLGGLSLGLGGIYDRIENPERDANGNKPRRDDFKATLTLTVSF